MKNAINEIGGAVGVFVLAPLLVYAALGIASALFVWASAQTTPLWHRYVLCLGVTLFVVGIQRNSP